MPIQIQEEKHLSEALLSEATPLFDAFCKQEGIPPSAIVDVTLVSKEEIQSLNHTYRNVNAVTDVLSFPQYEDINELDSEPLILLGDIVICTARVQEQAILYGHSFAREFLYLLVHGLLHLVGYDHENEKDKAAMRQHEEAILTKIGMER